MSMIVAVPSEHPGGLTARLSPHFGHCEPFTLVTVDGDQVTDVLVVPNTGHAKGGCLEPVLFLSEKGACVLIASGMGMRPLSGFLDAGIMVLHDGGAQTVGDAISEMARGQLQSFNSERTCGGGGSCH
ncbi:MAG: NifB/NifX family molybdenum-iron cluster-binding protein [Rhodospirillales bacterium]|jgi:predicted Fe-Mo cluster-binding NifX family protein|nr:NifB/NifX family molybdenum-iron cluster-binding protein [Rhodospirillales bacterium]